MRSFYTLIFSLILGLIFSYSPAQVSLNIHSIPEETPEGDSLFVAGSFNQWNPKDPDFQLTRNKNVWTVIIPEGTGIAEFKFTRGSWSKVEGNQEGGSAQNRSFSFTGKAQSFDYDILSWEKLVENNHSTAAKNVQVLDEEFYIPQLDRYRKIWVYLPPDYEISDKTYPVIYMHDGQNLFDDQTSFSGEWQVDETLNALFEKGDYGSIVIGIENGGSHRLDEYSPWRNQEFGGGEGDFYVDFIHETLKPFVDTTYRTKPQPKSTAIMGSSMGGLISTYAGLKYPSTFGKVAALSPSYWFNFEGVIECISGSNKDYSDLRIHFSGSRNESGVLEENILRVKEEWLKKGLNPANIFIKIDDYGAHQEAYWAGEFEEIYLWLFGENED